MRTWYQAVRTGITICYSRATTAAVNVRTWLIEPQNTDRRIYCIVKCIVYVLVGALTVYVGWKGIQLAAAGLTASQQSNLLAAKQICYGEVRTSSKSSNEFGCSHSNRISPPRTICGVRIAVSIRLWVALWAPRQPRQLRCPMT